MSGLRIRKLSLLVCCLVVSSAAARAQPSPQQPVKTQSERITALETRVEGLTSWLSAVNELTGDRSIFLDCDSGKFSSVMAKSSTLVFFASCMAITPYLEGYRITLNLANTGSMTISGVSGELGYGETPGKTYGTHAPFSTTEPLTPGAWTSILVTINPAAAKDVRSIRLYDLAFSTAKGR